MKRTIILACLTLVLVFSTTLSFASSATTLEELRRCAIAYRTNWATFDSGEEIDYIWTGGTPPGTQWIFRSRGWAGTTGPISIIKITLNSTGGITAADIFFYNDSPTTVLVGGGVTFGRFAVSTYKEVNRYDGSLDKIRSSGIHIYHEGNSTSFLSWYDQKIDSSTLYYNTPGDGPNKMKHQTTSNELFFYSRAGAASITMQYSTTEDNYYASGAQKDHHYEFESYMPGADIVKETRDETYYDLFHSGAMKSSHTYIEYADGRKCDTRIAWHSPGTQAMYVQKTTNADGSYTITYQTWDTDGCELSGGTQSYDAYGVPIDDYSGSYDGTGGGTAAAGAGDTGGSDESGSSDSSTGSSSTEEDGTSGDGTAVDTSGSDESSSSEELISSDADILAGKTALQEQIDSEQEQLGELEEQGIVIVPTIQDPMLSSSSYEVPSP